MNTLLRVLRYSSNLGPRFLLFLFYSVVGIFFTALSFSLLIPLLNVLFEKVNVTGVEPLPEFSVSVNYAMALFRHYFSSVIMQYGKPAALLFVCICLVSAYAIGNTFRFLERLLATRIRTEVVKKMRAHFFTNVTRLQIGFFNNQRKGDLISRFTSDMGEIENTVLNYFKAVIKEPITIIVYFSMLFFISVKFTLFTLIVLPITGGVVAEIIKRLRKQADDSQQTMGRMVNILDETFSGMRVVKAFNARGYILGKMEEENDRYRKLNYSIGKKNELSSPLSEVLGIIIVAGILYFGGRLVLNGTEQLEATTFIVFLALFAQIIQPAKNFSNGITSLQKGIASAKRVFDVIDLEPVIENKPNAIRVASFNQEIELKHVSFAYDKEAVLKNISLRIEKGKTVALVGPSGGGKSTLADLVPRFYDPTEGDVLLDGVSLRDYDIESLRQQMGIVTQESILFNDSIFNNIAFGMPHVSEADVMQAAKIANAHEFIMQTEKGYQTIIGERGSKLSGGQRQRLSIARAVLKNPPILILDEATSALDSESEKLVQDALVNLMRNRTSLVIAHRLSTILHADEIVVIQNGEIIERGTHDDLIRMNGLYRRLSEIQKMEA
ncbi:MAG: ABC transporter ATP-binding protein [Cyclobacteriaceae bacterium]|jgi:subfamily B ATP-binding cassette protein MsbA